MIIEIDDERKSPFDDSGHHYADIIAPCNFLNTLSGNHITEAPRNMAVALYRQRISKEDLISPDKIWDPTLKWWKIAENLSRKPKEEISQPIEYIKKLIELNKFLERITFMQECEEALRELYEIQDQYKTQK
ncbi:MAG: hypothetical protein ABIH39_06915 [Candidatus Margulisiibacteriota bacterium]